MRRSSESSLLSYHSVDLTDHPEYPDTDSPPNESHYQPRHDHRVRFGSDLRYEYGDTTDEDNHRDGENTVNAQIGQRSSHRRSLSARVRSWVARLRPSDEDGGDLQPVDIHHPPSSPVEEKEGDANAEAYRLVRVATREGESQGHQNQSQSQSQSQSPDIQSPHIPSVLQGTGVLSQLLRLNSVSHDAGHEHHHTPQSGQNQQRRHHRNQSQDEGRQSIAPPPPTPRGSPTPSKKKPKWYKKPNNSTSTLVGASTTAGTSTPVCSEMMSAASKRLSQLQPTPGVRLEDEIQITLQIAEILSRQRYILQLCRALMTFGAPTHRLEEYMQMTARTLSVESQYLYVPGCMIISFDDASTRTTEVKLVRVAQGIDLGRLADTHSVYKNVVHDVIGIEEATHELDEIMKRSPRFNKLILVLVYGLATAMVGPFAFDARPIDLPIIFANGILLAIMQHVLAPRSVLYSNVFEVTATILTSFIARALGTLAWDDAGSPDIPSSDNSKEDDYIFCFSAIAQSSIALILPGYTVLCSSLELQSHQIVAGSIRMVYAIIYSLFLGYGITVGTTIYGLLDADAVSSLTCPSSHGGRIENPYLQRFPFVAGFAACLMLVNQGKWKQAPIMILIAEAGYVTNYFVTRKLGSSSQVANTVGAFTIGVMGNLYSRLWHGHAATAILPGIFVLVPSGLAASGSLISGVESANEVRGNVSGWANMTGSATVDNTAAIDVLGFGMVEVAISITVGLFVAALVVYPLGKKKSGLFSF